MTNNIAYDDYSFNNNTVTHEKCKPHNVYRSRKGVCAGYANLFQFLCGFAELDCMVVNGYAKGIGHYQGKIYNQTNHAWNVCEFDNEFHLFDVTWAAGYYEYGRFQKSFDEFWWDTPPELFITSHYAENAIFNNLGYPVSKYQFEQMKAITENPRLKEQSVISEKPALYCSLGLSTELSTLYERDNGPYFANAQIGWKKGKRGYQQKFWGVFPSVDLSKGYPFTVEGGTVLSRFLRLSAGTRFIPGEINDRKTRTICPSATIGLQIHLGHLFAEVNLNGYYTQEMLNNRCSAVIGFRF